MNPLSLIGLGTGILGSIGKLFGRGAANRRLAELQKSEPVYQANPIANQRLGLAKTLLNAKMPGSQTIERNIYGNQASTISNINRNATDSSQALALGSSVQGQTNDAFGKLGLEEGQDYQRRYGNYTNAQEGVINEGDKVFQDSVRRFSDRAQIEGAQSENRTNNWSDISNLGFGLADIGMSGGFKGNAFKKQTIFGNSNWGNNPSGYINGTGF